jgi:hypothetical protein
MTTQSLPSLYDRLGGVYSIATVVDDFIDRIMIDPRLNANPKVDEAHHRVPPAGFKYLVTEMVCWATGGPQKYTGRSGVTGKAVGNAPGATVNDIPWLKLDVVNRRGSGTLADVTTVQRINTHGGAAQGACDQVGAFRSVPYSADYVFLSKRK